MNQNWFYPVPCMGCQMAKKGRELFCISCARDLELVSLHERCRMCFKETPLDTCFECLEKGDTLIGRRAYCLEDEGPWESFIYKAPTKTQAAILVYQYIHLDWEWGEVVYSTDSFFGREVAHFLGRPFRKRGPFYGEHVLVVEKGEKELDSLSWLLDKGALSIDRLSLVMRAGEFGDMDGNLKDQARGDKGSFKHF